MPIGYVNVAGVAAPTGVEGAHSSLRTILRYTGSELVDGACVQVPLSRSSLRADGSVADPEALARIGEAFEALVGHVRSTRGE